MIQSFLLTIYATYGILFIVPTEYPTYEQCVYHGEQIMEERMKWKTHLDCPQDMNVKKSKMTYADNSPS